MTTFLANFLVSLFAGTLIVIFTITLALILVSRLDTINRNNYLVEEKIES